MSELARRVVELFCSCHVDEAVCFVDAVVVRLDAADRLAERLTRQGIIARDLHQRLGAAGLFVRGDDRLQRQNVERGGASRLAGDEGFGRSEERRVGKEGGSTGRSGWWPDH